MNDSPENKDKIIDNYDGIYFAAILFKHKWFIIITVFVVTAASVIISLNLKNEFKSTVSVVPPKSSASMLESAMGNISSALKDFGLSKIGGAGGGAGYDFQVILDSRSIQDSLIKEFNLIQRYEIDDSLMLYAREELGANLDITYEKEGNYTISVWDTDPDTASIMANYIVELANRKGLELFRMEAKANSEYLSGRMRYTDSMMTIKADSLARFSRENSVYYPEEQARAISGALADLKAKKVESEIYYELFKSNFGENDPYTMFQKKINEELKEQLNEIQDKPGFAGNFTISEAAGVGIEYFRLYAEVETYGKIKALLTPMLEKAKIDETQNSISLFVVDEAIPADKKDRPKRSFIVAGSCLGSFILAIMFVVIKYSVRNFRLKYKEFESKLG